MDKGSAAETHRAPLALALVVSINSALSARGLTRDAFKAVLNEFLPPNRRINLNHSGTVQLNNWLNPTGPHWPEPKGEIVLAMQRALGKITGL